MAQAQWAAEPAQEGARAEAADRGAWADRAQGREEIAFVRSVAREFRINRVCLAMK